MGKLDSLCFVGLDACWIGCLLDWMRPASSKAGGLKKRTGRTHCRRDACNPAALCASLDWMLAGLDASRIQ